MRPISKLTFSILLALSFGQGSFAANQDICRDLFAGKDSEALAAVKRDIVLETMTDAEKSTFYRYRNAIETGLTKYAKKHQALARTVFDPQTGILASKMIIRNSKYSLRAGYYIFKTDMAGYGFLDELKDAVARGVDVHLFVDSLGSPSKNFLHEELKALIEYANKNAGFKHDPNDYSKLLNEKAEVKVAVFNPVNPKELLNREFQNIMRRAQNVEADLHEEGMKLHNWFNQHSGNKEVISPEFESFYQQVQNGKISPSERMILITDWVNRRSHNKELMADVEHFDLAVYKNGGRNVGEDYFDLPKVNDGTYQDVEVIVRNNPNLPEEEKAKNHIGGVLMPFYDSLFWNSGNQFLHTGFFNDVTGGYSQQIAKMEAATKAFNESPELSSKLAAMNDPNNNFLDPQNFHTVSWALLNEMENVLRHNVDKNPDLVKNKRNQSLQNGSSILKNIYSRINASTKTVKIISPYLDLTPEEIDFIKTMAAKGVQFEIITNSIMTSDNMPAQAIVDQTVGPVFAGIKNVTVYEFGKRDAVALGGTVPYGKLHAKIAIIDGEWTFVGTYNGDMRSRNLNSETMQKIRSIGLSQEFEDLFEKFKSRSHVFGSQEWHDIRTNPKIGVEKRIIAAHQDRVLKALNLLNIHWSI